MTLGEQLYLGLIVVAFFIFGLTLALVSWQTSRAVRHEAAEQGADRAPSPLDKVA